MTFECMLDVEFPTESREGAIQLAGANYTQPYYGALAVRYVATRATERLLECTWAGRTFKLVSLPRRVTLQMVEGFVEDAGPPDANGNVRNDVVIAKITDVVIR